MVDLAVFLERASRWLPGLISYAFHERQISPITGSDSVYTFYVVTVYQCAMIAHKQGRAPAPFAHHDNFRQTGGRLDNLNVSL
jgi:hypothetical protein